MKITVFSSNQSRHLSLVSKLSKLAEHVYFISEVNTVHPGKVEDFYKKSDIFKTYFKNVITSEKKLFGEITFSIDNVKVLPIKSGDLNLMTQNQLNEALKSDLYIVFGASYIKGWLIDFLIKKKALNIHMGISPYYRGSSCNFWALYDNNFGYVGATIHLLGKGLDSGEMLLHCLPRFKSEDTPFDFSMRAVLAAHDGLIKSIKNETIFSLIPKKQDINQQVRYSKNIEFTDEIANDFLKRKINLTNDTIRYPELLRPFFT